MDDLLFVRALDEMSMMVFEHTGNAQLVHKTSHEAASSDDILVASLRYPFDIDLMTCEQPISNRFYHIGSLSHTSSWATNTITPNGATSLQSWLVK